MAWDLWHKPHVNFLRLSLSIWFNICQLLPCTIIILSIYYIYIQYSTMFWIWTRFSSWAWPFGLRLFEEMRKVATHVLPGREAKAKPAMPPPKAAPVMRAPGYTPGFTPVYGVPGVPQRMAPQMAFKYRTMEASAPKAPEKGPEINTPSAPSAASAANAPSANTASKGEDRPQKSERRGVTKRWEAVRERALTLLAAPSGSPRDGASPPQSAKRRKGRRTDGDAYRDRALTLLASSKSESMKEKTKTFIEKHQVDIPLNSEADEIQGDKQSEQQNDETLQKPLPESPEKLLPETCDQPEGVDGVASPEKCQSPEKEDLPAEMCGTPSEKGSMSLAKSSTPKKLGSTSPAKSNIPEEPPGDETQLAQVQASIFWILGCLFECLLLGLLRHSFYIWFCLIHCKRVVSANSAEFVQVCSCACLSYFVVVCCFCSFQAQVLLRAPLLLLCQKHYPQRTQETFWQCHGTGPRDDGCVWWACEVRGGRVCWC